MTDDTRQQALATYVANLFAPEDALLAELRQEIPRRGLPEIQVSAEQGRLLQVLLAAVDARRVLEIGTLAGYSAIWMARALAPGGRLITLEIEERHASVAREFARRARLDSIIEVRVGPALEALVDLEREGGEPFDACFIDADKPGYPAYLAHALRLVRPGGMILGDNAFLDGRVIDAPETDEAARAMREFNHDIARHPELSSTIVPIRDGLSISILRPTPSPSPSPGPGPEN